MAVANMNIGAQASTIGMTLFRKRDNSADASGAAVTLQAAPGANKRLNVTRLIMSSVTALTVTIRDATPTVYAGPYYFGASTGTLDIWFAEPLYLADNKALQYITSGAGGITIEVEGFTSD